MKSMTGFGRCELTEGGVTVSLQVSSVNRKTLEVMCSLPKELQSIERLVTDRARAAVARGRLQFSVEVRQDAAATIGALPSDDQFDAALARLGSVAKRHGADFVVDAALLAQVAALIEKADGAAKLPEVLCEALILRATDEALRQMLAMRTQEGSALQLDLAARGQRLATMVREAKQLSVGMVAKYREGLFARLEQGGLSLDLNDERVLREIALFADRSDVSEEMTRLESHLGQFAQLVAKDEAVGRPLEFLLQEIGREINTTGSKSCSIELSRLAMEMKNELERMREQVANVE